MLDLLTDHIDSDNISVALIHELFAKVRSNESCSSDDALVVTQEKDREEFILVYKIDDINVSL